MIEGRVSSDLQPIVELRLLDGDGETRVTQAIIDTGFNGSLTLPEPILVSLGADRIGSERALLADGSLAVFDVYLIQLEWFGNVRRVEAALSDSFPLAGMSLLEGSRLRVEANRGGAVEIFPQG
ncbi:MAG: clan AA aspartic protease [Planctomycetota bacterium]